MTILPVFEPYVLSPLDHLTIPIHLSTFITFDPEHPSNAVLALETGLLRLISLLPFLAGNVTFSGRLEGKKNVREVQVATAAFLREHPMLKIRYHDKSISPMKSGLSVSYDTMLNEEFIPIPFAMAMEDLSPVFRAQANIMRDGVILCFSFHHLAMDGIGFNNAMKSLANCCRNPGLTSLATDSCKEAQTRRVIVEAGLDPNAQQGMYAHFGAYIGDSTPNQSPKSPITRVLILDSEKIAYLRNACNSQLQRQSDTQSVYLSSSTIISSLIWLCFIRSQYGSLSTQDKSDQEAIPEKSCLAVAIDARNILQLPLSYMGNAALGGESFARIDAVVSSLTQPCENFAATKDINSVDIKILAELSHQTYEAIQPITKQYVQGLISRFSTGNDWASFAQPGDVSLSNLRHFQLYGLDFGSCLGQVKNFDMPENRMSGVGWIMPARFKDAPWEVRMALEPAIMERVQRDRLMKWVCVKQMPKL